jgi:hypothetical protein
MCDMRRCYVYQVCACYRQGDGDRRRGNADDRYADDIHINREMREVERWNDPASEFLTVSLDPVSFLISHPQKS